MKRFGLLLNRPSRLRDMLRVTFNLPLSAGNDSGYKPERRHTDGRRKIQQTAYLQYTGGIDRRCSTGRRANDPRSPISFIGEFL